MNAKWAGTDRASAEHLRQLAGLQKEVARRPEYKAKEEAIAALEAKANVARAALEEEILAATIAEAVARSLWRRKREE
jgi:hypothetical protein